MPIEDGDMKRRWEKREQMRKKQKKQRILTILGLVVAGIVLAAVGVLIYLNRPPKAPEVTQPQQTTLASTAPSATTAPAGTTASGSSDLTVITLAAAGDLNVTDKVLASGDIMYNFSNAFLDVVPLLSDADVTVLNFEGNLAGEPYGGDSRSAPKSLADALRNAGVDLVQVANSWSLKNGMIGLGETLTTFRAAGLEPLGAYANAKEAQKGGGYTICTVQGVRIAFVAFTKGMDSGTSLPSGSEKCVNVLYTDYNSTYSRVDEQGIRDVLEAVQDERPDLVVAMVHWGSEYNDTVSDSQKKIRDILFDEGVDAILGSHSHFLQSMEFDKKSGRFIAYSLGDFFGDAQRSGTAYSVVLNLEITKNNRSGETKITGYSYTPIYTTTASDGLLRVMRLREAITAYENKYLDRVSESVYNDMKYALQRVDERIKAKVKD